MTAATAYPVTMTELRGEPTHGSLWSSYGNSAHIPGRLPSSIDAGFPAPSASASHPRGRNEQPPTDQSGYAYGRYGQEDAEAYDRQPQQGALSSQQGYPNLKRSFSQTEAPYQEIVQDLRDDGSRLNMSQDHKLLAFRRAQDKHTILDQQGRIQQFELSAQLHGMFFLSEMPANTNDGGVLQPELTCYRRNLFQISGSLITPRGQLSIVGESGENLPVSNMEVTVSAIESVDGNAVRLIVIPWKTPPPNSPDVSQNPDQEPAALPLIPFQEENPQAEGEYAVYPIGWRRLQFRIATANNGRRKELQQHFVLHLKVMGTLADGSKVVLTESTTAPIVVRGRSPRNFQARKEIPLLGSSAGSRGQALVETGLGVVAGTLGMKPQDTKPRPINMPPHPRAAFSFSTQKLPGPPQPGPVRSNTYPTWASPNATPMSQLPSTSPSSYPASSIPNDAYSKMPHSGGPGFSSEQHSLPVPTSMAPSVPLSVDSHDHAQPSMRPQYTYMQPTDAAAGSGNLNVPRYVDESRPSKSARHAGQPAMHSSPTEAAPEYRYGSYPPANTSSGPVSASNYHPDASGHYPPVNTWTTSANEPASSSTYANGDGRSYSHFPQDQYKAPAAPSSGVKTESRSAYDGVGNYSWTGN